MTVLSSLSNQELLNNAISALRDRQYDDAIRFSEKLLKSLPEHPSANAIAFSSYYKSQKFEQARKIGDRAARLNPNVESILNNQACLQLDAKQADKAAKLWQILIDDYGEKPQWLYNLGLALRMEAKFEESILKLERTLDIEPRHDKAVFQLVELYRQIGRLDKATIKSNYLRLLRPTHAPSHSEYISLAVASNLICKDDLVQEAMLWNKRFIPQRKNANITPIQNRTALRLGFIIGQIPPSWWQSMVLPLISQLQAQDHISVYWCDRENTVSGLTQETKFIDCTNLPDSQFVKNISDDKIDILIDVCGMRRGCKQRSLGLQLATEQFGWLAHEGIYAAHDVTPIEKLLGDQQFCIQSSEALILGISGYNQKTLFGINCENGLCEATVATWTQILNQLDGWVLHLDAIRVEVKNELLDKFSRHQIDSSRLNFDKQKLASKGDLVLENLSNNNVVNSFAAISGGSTVIALAGEMFPAQRSAALLNQLNHQDWVVTSQAEYVELALQMTSGTTPRVTIDKKEIEQSKIEDIEHFAKQFRECLLMST